MSARIDGQALNVADGPIRGVHAVPAADGQLAGWNGVKGNGLRGGNARRPQGRRRASAAQTVVRPGQDLGGAVFGVSGGARDELGFLGGVEPVELFQGAAEPDLGLRAGGEIDRGGPTQALPVLGLHDQVGPRLGDRIGHDAGHLTTGTVGATGFGTDHEFCRLRHRVLQGLLGLGGPSAFFGDVPAWAGANRRSADGVGHRPPPGSDKSYHQPMRPTSHLPPRPTAGAIPGTAVPAAGVSDGATSAGPISAGKGAGSGAIPAGAVSAGGIPAGGVPAGGLSAEVAGAVPAGAAMATMLAVAARTAWTIRCIALGYIVVQVVIWHSFFTARPERLAGPAVAVLCAAAVATRLWWSQ